MNNDSQAIKKRVPKIIEDMIANTLANGFLIFVVIAIFWVGKYTERIEQVEKEQFKMSDNFEKTNAGIAQNIIDIKKDIHSIMTNIKGWQQQSDAQAEAVNKIEQRIWDSKDNKRS